MRMLHKDILILNNGLAQLNFLKAAMENNCAIKCEYVEDFADDTIYLHLYLKEKPDMHCLVEKGIKECYPDDEYRVAVATDMDGNPHVSIDDMDTCNVILDEDVIRLAMEDTNA